MSLLVLLLSLALPGGGAPPLLAHNAEPWSYVSPPLVGHCLQTYRLFLPPDESARPADGWPVLVHLGLSGFAVTDDVVELTEESFLYHVVASGVAVVVARVTPSASLDAEVWTTACDPVPEIPGHGLVHPPGYVPPDLAEAGVAPYDDPDYPTCIEDAVLAVQHVRHGARGGAPFGNDESEALALLDPERVGVSGRSAGSLGAMWTSLGPDRRDEAPFAGLGGAYDEPTRVNLAVLLLGTVWIPVFRDEQSFVAAFLGHGGHSEVPADELGDADPVEKVALSALAFEERATNGALPVYMLYNERSVCTDYSPSAKPKGGLPFRFAGQGHDGVFGPHPAWNGYAWKRRHPARTRLVLDDPLPYAQRKGLGATLLEPGQAQYDDLVGWLHDAFAASDADGLHDGADAFVVPGDRVRATLDADEARTIVFEGLEGSKLTLDARSVKASGAEPTLELRGPDGLVRVASDASVLSATRARIALHELDATGVWTIVLRNAGAETGELRLRSKARNPPAIVEILPLGGEDGAPGLAFDAVGGTRVRGARVRRVAPPDGSVLPQDVAAALLPAAEALRSSGAFTLDLHPFAQTSGKGGKVKLAPFEVPALGEQLLELAALDGTQGFVRVRLRRALPRGHETYVLD